MAAEDREWRPNGRPQSTIARSFSNDLHNAFSIDSSLEGLAKSVEQKKQAVNSQSQELEALEARLRETEERLKQKGGGSSPGTARQKSGNTPHRRQPLGGTFTGQENERPSERNQTPTKSPSVGTESPWLSSIRPESQSPTQGGDPQADRAPSTAKRFHMP